MEVLFTVLGVIALIGAGDAVFRYAWSRDDNPFAKVGKKGEIGVGNEGKMERMNERQVFKNKEESIFDQKRRAVHRDETTERHAAKRAENDLAKLGIIAGEDGMLRIDDCTYHIPTRTLVRHHMNSAVEKTILPNWVEHIAERGCRGIFGEIILNEGLKTIGKEAFADCGNVFANGVGSVNIEIPSTVESIADDAFLYAPLGSLIFNVDGQKIKIPFEYNDVLGEPLDFESPVSFHKEGQHWEVTVANTVGEERMVKKTSDFYRKNKMMR